MNRRPGILRKFRCNKKYTLQFRFAALILCVICACPVLFSQNMPFFAETDLPPALETPEPSGEETEAPGDELQNALIALQESDMSYILYDTEKGQTFLSGKTEESVNASLLARMMACLIVLENHNLTDKIMATRTTVSTDGNFTLTAGSTYTVDALVNTALLGNADNAIRLLADNTELSSTTEESFIAYMNDRALRLGMNDTYFTSVDGAENPLQKTTVYDTALFLRYALNNSRFKNIYCSPFALSWDGIIIYNSNNIVIENTTDTVGGSFGLFNNTEEAGTVTYYIQTGGENELQTSHIILIISGVTEDDLVLMQRALLQEFNTVWKKVLYIQKDDIVNTIFLGEGKLNMAIGSSIYFYAPVAIPDYVETISFSYLDGMSPETIRLPVSRGDHLGTVRYRLKDGTTIEAPLYAQNTIISERQAVNNFISLMSDYTEIFFGMGCLFLIAAAIALYKIIWFILLKKS